MTTVSTIYRPTVAGLVVRRAEPFPLILIHWPSKAAQKGEENLSTAGGGMNPGETPAQAMARELEEEYQVTDALITPMSHPDWHFHGKRYHWCLVECLTRPQVVPLREEVAAIGWYASPSCLQQAMKQMHDSKRYMFVRALGIALNLAPELFGPYRAYAKAQLRARNQ